MKKYKSLLLKNPKSKVFYPLAQIYRLNNQLQEAEKICLQGLKHHPNYATGYILLAKIYRAQKQNQKAFKSLNQAKELSPDNYQIYQLLGELYREQKDIEKTLSAFKMVAFIRPWDQTAKKTIQHLENSLSRQNQWIQNSKNKQAAIHSAAPSQQNQKTSDSLPPPSKTSTKIHKLQRLQKLLSRVEKHCAPEISET